MTTERTDLTPVALGLCLVGLGVVLVLHNLGFLDAAQALRLWPVALIVLGGVMLWSTLRGGPDARPRVSMGAVVWVVILGFVLSHAFERRGAAGDGGVNLFAVMSEDKRPIPAGHFQGARMTAVMGASELDLRQAVVAPGEEVVVDVFTVMGGNDIRVPGHWKVDMRATAIAAGIKDRRTLLSSKRDSERAESREEAASPALVVGTRPEQAAAAPGGTAGPGPLPVPVENAPEPAAGTAPPTLVVRGFVIFGGLSIKP